VAVSTGDLKARALHCATTGDSVALLEGIIYALLHLAEIQERKECPHPSHKEEK